MPGIEIKGRSKIANYRHGGRTGKFGGGRTNLLEELGRVEGERFQSEIVELKYLEFMEN